VKRSPLLILIIPLILQGCQEKLNLGNHDFPYVFTYDVSDIDSTGVTMRGEILYDHNSEIIQSGFIWYSDRYPSLDNTGIRSDFYYLLDDPETTGPFESRISYDIENGVTVYARAFAKTKTYTVYGNIVNFNAEGCLKHEIESVTPEQGSDYSKFVIEGDNLSTNSERIKLKIGSRNAYIDSLYHNIIVARVPILLPVGDHPVTVEIDDYTVTANRQFSVLAPVIESVSPSEGAFGTTITITGQYFGISTYKVRVLIGGLPAGLISVTDDTIIAETPLQGSMGEVDLTVDITGKMTTFGEPFTVLASQPNQ
jgi:hypothetical protein